MSSNSQVKVELDWSLDAYFPILQTNYKRVKNLHSSLLPSSGWKLFFCYTTGGLNLSSPLSTVHKLWSGVAQYSQYFFICFCESASNSAFLWKLDNTSSDRCRRGMIPPSTWTMSSPHEEHSLSSSRLGSSDPWGDSVAFFPAWTLRSVLWTDAFFLPAVSCRAGGPSEF